LWLLAVGADHDQLAVGQGDRIGDECAGEWVAEHAAARPVASKAAVEVAVGGATGRGDAAECGEQQKQHYCSDELRHWCASFSV